MPTNVCRYSSSASSCASASTMAIITDAPTVQEMLYRVREINHMDDAVRQSLLEFRVDGLALGKVTPATAQLLTNVPVAPPVFCIQNDNKNDENNDSRSRSSSSSYLTLDPSVGSTATDRTAAVATVTEYLRDDGRVRGWRDELFPVAASFYQEPCFLMERAAVPLLGVLEYGVHINGVVVDTEGETKMWMARRSATKSKYPGMLDHIVAGGQPAGMSLMDNVVKECLEEAGIPETITRSGIQAVGAISYETHQPTKDTVTRAVMFCFDLHLPADFQPTPVDGEVQDFFLWDMRQIIESMPREYPDPIKPNCYSVIVDFLVRKGFVSPDTPGYLDILRELRSGDCC